ncbi:JAB domain-containing protein [Arthrospiribacter ruber]|uniref:MPN domain-containing protein n=1 Tax=Arthrospiribacter ruber TaxID=2487934 RepID=A0A951J0Y2_9BACT|nr:hypothetical protein [Arthrospiribacter ruber]
MEQIAPSQTPKENFKHALENQSCSLILVHNHPSGNIRPSEQDKRLTQKLSDAGKHLDIIVLDHIIFTEVLNQLCRRRQEVMESGGRGASFFA